MKPYLLAAEIIIFTGPGFSQTQIDSAASRQTASIDEPSFLKDRGTGVSTSMFATYIRKGEFILYPFFEYYHDQNAEYKPRELGYGLDADFRSRYRAYEGLVFLAYGISDAIAIELEAAVISARLFKSVQDPSAMPQEIRESGLGDVESQLRWRWSEESEKNPELFSYFETVFPLQKTRKLIGTQHWEFKAGTGAIKGFNWGTMSVRFALEYSAGEQILEPGEYAVEYVRRVSDLFRFYVGVEGTQDEIELITDLQFHIMPRAFIRINNAFGITSKTTDYAPEVGILFYL